MATLYISEFKDGASAIGTKHPEILPQPSIVDQTVAIAAGSAQSAAFNVNTRAILLTCDAICSIVIGPKVAGTVAAATNFRLPANVQPIAFGVPAGYCVAVITNS